MFDAQSAELLRSAPSVYDIDPDSLPQTLTDSYALLVTERLKADDDDGSSEDARIALLLTIAEAYETIASLSQEDKLRKASAFVSGSAYQILSRNDRYLERYNAELFGRDHIAASIATILLFLTAEQYPDAYEAASYINVGYVTQSDLFYRMLGETIRDLGKGSYEEILLRAERRARLPEFEGDIYQTATYLLFDTILECVEYLASRILDVSPPATFSNRFETPQEGFERVVYLSSYNHTGTESGVEPSFVTTYPGPQHMAALLLKVAGTLESASIHKITPPSGADSDKWKDWLRHRARNKPVLWPNHREALDKGFHFSGRSAVMVLPTGAGKTTLSEVKIAGVLAQNKRVVFLAPTNALVEQLQHDLKEAFPEDLIGMSVSSELDLIFGIDEELQPIEVMTPEKCLALLNFVPSAFANTGLLVFDECHMIDVRAGNLRRALDSMLCILVFQKVVPSADFLFLSAMISNEDEFANWISELTNRECIPINIVWKPSRQARGVVIYSRDEINSSCRSAMAEQKKSKAKSSLSASAERQLIAKPRALFGLLHNWHPDNSEDVSLRKLSEEAVALSGSLKHDGIRIKANANKVAASLAIIAARAGLKTIVFVNQPNWTASTAKDINEKLEYDLQFNEREKNLWNAIQIELGEDQSSVLEGFTSAFPHNASLTALEQRLVESLFKRSDGIPVIVSTTTLSQGMNLPAQLAILAGDKRHAGGSNWEPLKAHELLNAAGRAGRAGHLANGMVLLIPQEVVYFNGNPSAPEANALDTLESILPPQERCVHIADPLQRVLDYVQDGDEVNRDVSYIFYRLLDQTDDGDTTPPNLDILSQSFAAYQAKRRAETDVFNEKVRVFKEKLAELKDQDTPAWLIKMTTQSGISPTVLMDLYNHVKKNAGHLPSSVTEWVYWLLKYLKNNSEAVDFCFGYNLDKVRTAVGRSGNDNLTDNDFDTLYTGLEAWISGEPLNTVNQTLGGMDAKIERARALATSVAPYSFSFFLNIIAQVTSIVCSDLGMTYKNPAVLECLSTAVKRGFDSPEKVAYAALNQSKFLSRVEAHQNFNIHFPNGLEMSDDARYSDVYSQLNSHLNLKITQDDMGKELKQ